MYNVKGPSKIVAKTTRRGVAQNMDNIRDYGKNKGIENDECETTSVSKLVFHNKKSTNHHQHHTRQETITPQHEEIIKFIKESWNLAYLEAYQEFGNNENNSKDHSIFYEEESNNVFPENFKPFDLESWWGKRLYNHLTSSGNGKS